MPARLLEFMDSEGESIYEFEDLEEIKKRDELKCFGYAERNAEDWRNIALRELDNVLFDIRLRWPYKLNIEGLLEQEKRHKEVLEELSFLNYHNPFRKEYWKNKSGHAFIEDTYSFSLGGIGALAYSPAIGGGAFACTEIFLEFLRRGKIKKEKQRLGEFQRRIENYNSTRSLLEQAKIISFTPEEAKNVVKDIKNLPRFTMIDDERLNDYLKEVYQRA